MGFESEPWTLGTLLSMRPYPTDVLGLSAILHVPLVDRFATGGLVSFFATGPAPHKGASAMDFQTLLGHLGTQTRSEHIQTKQSPTEPLTSLSISYY